MLTLQIGLDIFGRIGVLGEVVVVAFPVVLHADIVGCHILIVGTEDGLAANHSSHTTNETPRRAQLIVHAINVGSVLQCVACTILGIEGGAQALAETVGQVVVSGCVERQTETQFVDGFDNNAQLEVIACSLCLRPVGEA